MGNSALGREFSTRRISLEEREAMKKFCDEEMHVLRETFKGLANVRNGYAVDKETFLKCFPMPGLLGGKVNAGICSLAGCNAQCSSVRTERLFEVIDRDGSGAIGYKEFVYGLAILFRGSQKEKMKFIFDLYDLSEYEFRVLGSLE